jgi:hypothetical protein
MPARDDDARTLYPPLDTLKPVAHDLWIVDSVHETVGLKLPVRMSVIRLGEGGLWLHSPTRCTNALLRELAELGEVRHLVAPNSVHWSYIAAWKQRCPDAKAWAAPGLAERWQVRHSRLTFDGELGNATPGAWADAIEQIVVPGGFGFSEVAFLHRRSRTLLLADLIENFEPQKLGLLGCMAMRVAGALAPDGKAPAYLRFVVKRKRREAAEAARLILTWEPERVIFAHGKWFGADGTARLLQSFRWLTGR